MGAQIKSELKYNTRDLYEAAALHASGEKLEGLETGKRPYIFVFSDYEVCKKKALEYINNELAVLAKDYAASIKLLKNRVNSV